MSAPSGRGADRWRWLHPPPPNGIPEPPGAPERPGPENWDDDPEEAGAPERDEDDPD
jgi:hypothetical protein